MHAYSEGGVAARYVRISLFYAYVGCALTKTVHTEGLPSIFSRARVPGVHAFLLGYSLIVLSYV